MNKCPIYYTGNCRFAHVPPACPTGFYEAQNGCLFISCPKNLDNIWANPVLPPQPNFLMPGPGTDSKTDYPGNQNFDSGASTGLPDALWYGVSFIVLLSLLLVILSVVRKLNRPLYNTLKQALLCCLCGSVITVTASIPLCLGNLVACVGENCCRRRFRRAPNFSFEAPSDDVEMQDVSQPTSGTDDNSDPGAGEAAEEIGEPHPYSKIKKVRFVRVSFGPSSSSTPNRNEMSDVTEIGSNLGDAIQSSLFATADGSSLEATETLDATGNQNSIENSNFTLFGTPNQPSCPFPLNTAITNFGPPDPKHPTNCTCFNCNTMILHNMNFMTGQVCRCHYCNFQKGWPCDCWKCIKCREITRQNHKAEEWGAEAEATDHLYENVESVAAAATEPMFANVESATADEPLYANVEEAFANEPHASNVEESAVAETIYGSTEAVASAEANPEDVGDLGVEDVGARDQDVEAGMLWNEDIFANESVHDTTVVKEGNDGLSGDLTDNKQPDERLQNVSNYQQDSDVAARPSVKVEVEVHANGDMLDKTTKKRSKRRTKKEIQASKVENLRQNPHNTRGKSRLLKNEETANLDKKVDPFSLETFD